MRTFSSWKQKRYVHITSYNKWTSYSSYKNLRLNLMTFVSIQCLNSWFVVQHFSIAKYSDFISKPFRLTLIGKRSSEIRKLKCKSYVSREKKKEKRKKRRRKSTDWPVWSAVSTRHSAIDLKTVNKFFLPAKVGIWCFNKNGFQNREMEGRATSGEKAESVLVIKFSTWSV